MDKKKIEDEKVSTTVSTTRPCTPTFGLYYISSNGFNSYWPVQRLNDGYLKSHSEGCCEYSHIKNPIIISAEHCHPLFCFV